MAAHQIGWLSATIADHEMSRAEELARIGRPLGVPEIDEGRYLLDAFYEVGRCEMSAFGWAALSWGSLAAYAQATGTISEPWEFRCIRRMSEAYLTGIGEGKNALSIAPVERDNG